MSQPQQVLLLAELLRQHTAFTRQFGPRDKNQSVLSDADYLLCWYLIGRLKIRCVSVDDESIAQFLRQQLQNEPDGRPQVTILCGADVDERLRTSAEQQGAQGPNLLYMFSAAAAVPAEILKAAASGDAVAFCYGYNGLLGQTPISNIAALNTAEEAPAIVPSAALGPALWRCASLLVARHRHGNLLQDAFRQFADLFNTRDLDALRLLEENMSLRERIAQLREPQTAQAEITRLSTDIGSLHAELDSLRRTATAQEHAIADLQTQLRQARHPAAAGPTDASGNGSPRNASRMP